MRAYYDRRAPEYDDWWLGTGLFAARERPGWAAEVARLEAVLAGLPPADTLDVACGTGFLTRHLRGTVTAVDQSPEMVAIAARRVPRARVVRADAAALPFAAGAFDRVLTSHFYGHLLAPERAPFLAEARRVGRELIVVDSALGPGARRGLAGARAARRLAPSRVQALVHRGRASPPSSAAPRTLHEGRWFVVVAGLRG